MKEKKQILLVDDEMNIINALKRILHGDQYEIFSTTVPEEAIEIINHTDERVDGKGYPKGLTGGQILLEAKILTMADTYDALVSDCVYHKGMESDKALELLQIESNQRYDPAVVEIFCGGMQSEKRHIVCGR